MPDDLNSAAMLSLRPSAYLKKGFFASPGKLQPELTGTAAFAVAQQLERAEASPDELVATYEALKQILAAAPTPSPEKFAAAIDQALSLVEGMLKITNNLMIEGWLRECVPFVKSGADIAGFLEHFQAVTRQYAALIAVKNP